MPIEKRQVLFYYSEFWPYFLNNGKDMDEQLKHVSDELPHDACHTSKLKGLMGERRKFFMDYVERRDLKPGLIILCRKKKLLPGTKETSIHIKDDVARELLINLCLSMNISIPKTADKNVITDDLCVGIEILYNNSGLQFA
jgi:hypothetical protein